MDVEVEVEVEEGHKNAEREVRAVAAERREGGVTWSVFAGEPFPPAGRRKGGLPYLGGEHFPLYKVVDAQHVDVRGVGYLVCGSV